MSDINRVTLIGRLGADPELRYSQAGKAVCNFRIAVNRRGKDAEADWIPCTAFDKLAEVCGQYLKRGKQVAVDGRLQTRTYEKDGQKRSAFDVIVSDMQLLGPRDEESAPAPQPQRPAVTQRPQQRMTGRQAVELMAPSQLDYDDVPF